MVGPVKLLDNSCMMEAWKLKGKHMKNYVTFSEAALKSAVAKISLRIPCDFAIF